MLAGSAARPGKLVVVVVGLEVVDVGQAFAFANRLETPLSALEVTLAIPLKIGAGFAA